MRRDLLPAAAGLAFAAAGLALAACSFDFGNAAEGLRAGEVRGRAVADRNGETGPSAGVSVTLKGAALTQATRATGLFSALPLPPGRHTLLLRKGATLAAEREVETGFGTDGQLEGIALGDVKLLKPVSVSGRATLPAFSGVTILSGVVVDEATGATARLDSAGDFRFPVLSAGAHRLKVFVRGDSAGVRSRWVGGPILLALGEADAGQAIALAPLALRAASGSGRVQLRLRGVGADLSPGAVTITGLPGAAADSTGLVDVSVPEGHHVVRVTGPAGLDGPGAAFEVIAMSGLVADAGTAYFVAPSAATQSALACASAADCACLDGTCTGTCTSAVCASGFSTPAALVAASVTFCPASAIDFCAPASCTPDPGDPALYCALPSGGNGTCLPCGVACTEDGLAATAPASGECGVP